jgi:hypothetical protein
MAARLPLAAPREVHGSREPAWRAQKPHRGFPPPRVFPAGLAPDCAVAIGSYVLSDYIAQVGEVSRPSCEEWDTLCEEPFEKGVSLTRLRRFATFGALDGVISHYWYRWLDDASSTWPSFAEITTRGFASDNVADVLTSAVVTPDSTAEISRVVEMVALDILVFSPWWCAMFLTSMAAMSHVENLDRESGWDNTAPSTGKITSTAAAVTRRLNSSWKQLYLGDLIAWIPLNCLLYGFVQVDHRVQAFGVINLLYTAVLSVWAEQTRKIERAADLGIDLQSDGGLMSVFRRNNALSRKTEASVEENENSVEEV